MNYPTVDEVLAANPGLDEGVAFELVEFARETVDQLVAYYGSLEVALADPGTPWQDAKRDLGLG